MKLRTIHLILALVIGIGIPTGSRAEVEPSPGQRLAQEMRQTQLLDYPEIFGALKTRGRRGKRTARTLTLRNSIAEGSWQTTFQATDPATGTVSRLTILRNPERAPEYYLATTPQSDAPDDLGNRLDSNQAMVPFANTDFWVADLGLEFFYWPEQTILRNARIKMRKGNSCYVLESRHGSPSKNGYTRVRSWISRKGGGLIYAEAFDVTGDMIKTFEVGDVEKVDGEWKLKTLKIYDAVARSTTVLVFDNE